MKVKVSVEMPFTKMVVTMPLLQAVELTKFISRWADKEIEYFGFLLIKCPRCGKIRAFYTKHPIGTYHCECGHDTELRDLRPVFHNCLCGDTLKYQTNIDEPSFTLTCNRCGRENRFNVSHSETAYVTSSNGFISEPLYPAGNRTVREF